MTDSMPQPRTWDEIINALEIELGVRLDTLRYQKTGFTTAMTDTKPEWGYAGHQSCRDEIERLNALLDHDSQVMNDQTMGSYSVLADNQRLQRALNLEVEMGVQRHKQYESKIERLRALLADALPYLEDTQDTGPLGMGWKSDDLLKLIHSIEQLVGHE